MENKKELLIKEIVDRKMAHIKEYLENNKEQASSCGGTPCTTSCMACAGM